jgi:molecular chaperone DnaJ
MEKEHNQFWVINSQKTYIHKSSNLSFMPSEIKVDLEIDFMDATRGTTKVVTIQRNEICESCSGHHKSSVYQCPECNGEGLNFTTLAGMTTMIACNSCKGTGEIGVACATCLGPGEMLREIKETVVIPKGTDTGDIIVFEGKGNLKSNKKDRGDLKVLVTVRDHPLF